MKKTGTISTRLGNASRVTKSSASPATDRQSRDRCLTLQWHISARNPRTPQDHRTVELLTSDEIASARAIVARHVAATPTISWPLLNARLGASAFVKHENHTAVGAFKVRGGADTETADPLEFLARVLVHIRQGARHDAVLWLVCQPPARHGREGRPGRHGCAARHGLRTTTGAHRGRPPLVGPPPADLQPTNELQVAQRNRAPLCGSRIRFIHGSGRKSTLSVGRSDGVRTGSCTGTRMGMCYRCQRAGRAWRRRTRSSSWRPGGRIFVRPI